MMEGLFKGRAASARPGVGVGPGFGFWSRAQFILCDELDQGEAAATWVTVRSAYAPSNTAGVHPITTSGHRGGAVSLCVRAFGARRAVRPNAHVFSLSTP